MAHHRDHDQARGPSPGARAHRIERSVDKRLARNPSPRVPQQWQDALPISRVQPDHRVGSPDSILARPTASRPGSQRLLWRIGSLSDDVGNAENICNLRTQPIWRLMIQMIGKPKLRTGLRRLAAAPNKTGGELRTGRGYPGL